MTQRKITYALNRIKSSKDNGCILEALLKSYHLNIDLIKYILSTSSHGYSAKDKKIKVIVHEFLQQITIDPKLKSIINKKTLKNVKPWLKNMDIFFKSLKFEQPSNIKYLQVETEKIFGILNISMNKLYSKSKP